MVLVDYPQVLCDCVVRSIGWQNRGSDDQSRRRNDRGRALGKRFQCQVMLPGVDPGDVNIQVLGNTLTIGGERSSHMQSLNCTSSVFRAESGTHMCLPNDRTNCDPS